MGIKCDVCDAKPDVSKMLWRSNWNNDHVQPDFDHTIDDTDSGGDFLDVVRKI